MKMGAPDLDFETRDGMNLNTRNYKSDNLTHWRNKL
jgi:hypothetical protein